MKYILSHNSATIHMKSNEFEKYKLNDNNCLWPNTCNKTSLEMHGDQTYTRSNL